VFSHIGFFSALSHLGHDWEPAEHGERTEIQMTNYRLQSEIHPRVTREDLVDLLNELTVVYLRACDAVISRIRPRKWT